MSTARDAGATLRPRPRHAFGQGRDRRGVRTGPGTRARRTALPCPAATELPEFSDGREEISGVSALPEDRSRLERAVAAAEELLRSADADGWPAEARVRLSELQGALVEHHERRPLVVHPGRWTGLLEEHFLQTRLLRRRWLELFASRLTSGGADPLTSRAELCAFVVTLQDDLLRERTCSRVESWQRENTAPIQLARG